MFSLVNSTEDTSAIPKIIVRHALKLIVAAQYLFSLLIVNSLVAGAIIGMIKSMTIAFGDGTQMEVSSCGKKFWVDGEDFSHSELVEYITIRAANVHPEMQQEDTGEKMKFVRSQRQLWNSALLLMM